MSAHLNASTDQSVKCGIIFVLCFWRLQQQFGTVHVIYNNIYIYIVLLFQAEFDKYLDQENETEEEFEAADKTKELFRLSDSTGKMSFTREKTDKINKADFDSQVGGERRSCLLVSTHSWAVPFMG